MGSVFSWVRQLGPAGFVLKAIIASVVGTGLLLGFILARRAYRRRYFRRRDVRTFAIRKTWNEIVSGVVPAETWRFDLMDREIVETMLLDRIEVAPTSGLASLLVFLRSSGLLDMRIHETRVAGGWRRQRALVSLGRMRAPEAIPAMSEGLDDPNAEARAAAVRGLGRTGLPEAAAPILERLWAGDLRVPQAPVQTALLNCCRARPALLLPHLRRAQGQTREVLARVLGELATAEMGDDLLLLAGDSLAEVRASAARALGEAKPQLALPVLCQLAGDPEWFVRLRAVAGLGALEDARAIQALIRALCDANRYVRLRAAAALARQESILEQILEQVVQTHDRYALQAMISELERSGELLKLTHALMDPAQRHTAAPILLEALRAGSQQLREAAAANLKPQKVTDR